MPQSIWGRFRARRAPWRPRFAALLLLVPACWLAVLFWQVPVDDPLTLSALLLDRILQVSTGVVLPLALLLTLGATWEIARPAAATGGAVSFLLGTSAAFAALRPPANWFPTALAVLSAAAGATLLIWVLHRLGRKKLAVLPLLAPLSLLPALQFWHQTSFLPAQLSTSLSVEPRVIVQNADGGRFHGVVEVAIHNKSDVAALVLASQLRICFRGSIAEQEKPCPPGQVMDALSTVDAKSTMTYHTPFEATPPDNAIISLYAAIWYARADRLRVARESAQDIPHPGKCDECSGKVTTYRLRDEARFKGVVQRDRLLVYDETKDNVKFYLTTSGQPLCQDPPRYQVHEQLGVRNFWVRSEEWLHVTK